MQEKVENLFLAESNETAKHFGSPIFLPLTSYLFHLTSESVRDPYNSWL